MTTGKTALANYITDWLKSYSNQSGTNGFINGISGGIDSAVTSTLCAQTGKKVICLNMPIHQKKDQLERAQEHIKWLQNKFPNVDSLTVDLTAIFEQILSTFPKEVANHALSMANTRARLRMTTLYAVGQTNGLLVAGTGNKIEDFGVGFFTKYGDGGVDLSPIADLTKSEVFLLGKSLGIHESIISAKPTDGLWEDDRSDEDQLGASYPELEWAMEFANKHAEIINNKTSVSENLQKNLTEKEKNVLGIYLKFHNINKHKMSSIPVCIIPANIRESD